MSRRLESLRTGPVLQLVLDRPEVHNALDPPLLSQLLAALERFRQHPELRVVILRGNGPSFSSGADIKAMAAMDASAFEEQTRLYQALARQFREVEKVSLAALHGHVIGGGVELALMADLRVAARSTTMALPDARLGFSPTGGLTHHLPRLIGHGRAAWMALGGVPVDSARALSWGLVSEVFPDETLVEQAQSIAETIAGYSPDGVRRTRRALRQSWHETFEETLEREYDDDQHCFADQGTRDALQSFLATRRDPRRR